MTSINVAEFLHLVTRGCFTRTKLAPIESFHELALESRFYDPSQNSLGFRSTESELRDRVLLPPVFRLSGVFALPFGACD